MIAGRPALTDLAGLDPAVQAAIVLAIEPRLRGLLLYGGRGSGKSAVIDGLLDVLPGGEHVSAVHHWELAAAAERSRLVADGLVLAASDSSEETEDRLGLIVYLPARSIAEDRLAVLSARRDETEARMLGERIAEAQGRLREIAIDPSAARSISPAWQRAPALPGRDAANPTPTICRPPCGLCSLRGPGLCPAPRRTKANAILGHQLPQPPARPANTPARGPIRLQAASSNLPPMPPRSAANQNACSHRPRTAASERTRRWSASSPWLEPRFRPSSSAGHAGSQRTRRAEVVRCLPFLRRA